MNISFKELNIQGFRSFDVEQSFPCEGPDGLYFLTGNNKAEPALGANGAGKSSAIEAWTWLLFGQTSRKLKGPDVKNWYGKEPLKVTGTLITDDHEITIQRTWKPISLKWSIDGGKFEDISEEQIQELMHMDIDMWVQSIIIPQVGDMFMDLKPTARAQIFGTVMNLEHWLDKSADAKSQADWLDGFMNDVVRDLERVEGQLEELAGKDMTDLVKKWNEDQDAKENDIEKAIKEEEKTLKKAEKELEDALKKADKAAENSDEFDDELKEAKETIAEIDKDIKEAQAEVDVVRDEINTVNSDIKLVDHDISRYEKEIKRYDGLEGTCSNCGQEIDEKHKAKEIDLLESKIKDCNKDKDKLEKSKDKLTDSMDKKKQKKAELEDERREANKTLSEIEEDRNEARSKVSKANNVVKDIEYEVRTAENNIKSKKRDLRTMKSEQNPYEAQMQANAEREESLRTFKGHLEDDLEGFRQEYQKVSFWIKGFKEVRLLMIAKALQQLEMETNHALHDLGLSDWEILFDVDRENKQGGTTKGFTVFIQSPSNTEPVKWEVWSGGESQRLKLAVNMGLSNLILSRAGINPDMEFWDEPSHGINQEGIVDLLDTLAKRARDHEKKIWIVDHSSLNYGGFEKTICVVKEKEGSHFEETSV